MIYKKVNRSIIKIMINGRRGFTLIELLVVIAIIGILSSVVLASLNTARSKGNDAKIKAQLSGLRVAAEIYYDDNGGNYGVAVDSCISGMFSNVASGMQQYTLATNYPSPASNGLSCHSNGTAYAVSAPLNAADPNDNWCVDSVGKSKPIGTALANGVTACP
ncbi:MAG: type II secretion system protein [bacterium]